MDAREIRETREKLDLTRSEFAQILGTNTATIWRWEVGNSSANKCSLIYIRTIQNITQNHPNIEELKKILKESLLIGGTLRAVYTILQLFYNEYLYTDKDLSAFSREQLLEFIINHKAGKSLKETVTKFEEPFD